MTRDEFLEKLETNFKMRVRNSFDLADLDAAISRGFNYEQIFRAVHITFNSPDKFRYFLNRPDKWSLATFLHPNRDSSIKDILLDGERRDKFRSSIEQANKDSSANQIKIKCLKCESALPIQFSKKLNEFGQVSGWIRDMDLYNQHYSICL